MWPRTPRLSGEKIRFENSPTRVLGSSVNLKDYNLDEKAEY